MRRRWPTLWRIPYGMRRSARVSIKSTSGLKRIPLMLSIPLTACLDVYTDPVTGNASFKLNNQSEQFQYRIEAWRGCVKNHTGAQNVTALCDRCGKSFNEMFDFYWRIYADPALDFCIDVEATMNSTTALWHDVWSCPDGPGPRLDRNKDMVVVCFAATLLVIVIGLFYAGSYIQTESAQRNLIQCEWINIGIF